MRCVGCGRFGHEAALCTTEPQSRKGQHLGGIRTLEDIRRRCDIDDECWRWNGALAASRGAICPVAWYAPEGRQVSVVRIAVMLSGRRLARSQMTWRTCSWEDCCNPDHIRVGTRKQWGAWVAKELRFKSDPSQIPVRRRARMKSGTALNMELASWVRESSQMGVDLAHALNTSRTTISRARLGRTWGAAPMGSVFTLAALSEFSIGRDATA